MKIGDLTLVILTVFWLIWTFFAVKNIKKTGFFGIENNFVTVTWQILHIIIPMIVAIVVGTSKLVTFLSNNWNTEL